jgi:protocatechuate 3,4-dioxygenase beta subunit
MKGVATAVLVFSLLHAPLFAPPQTQNASVAGVVLNADGEPVANARVTLGKLGVNLGSFFQLSGFDRETTIPADMLESMANQVALETSIVNVDPGAAFRAAALSTMPVDDIYEFTVTTAGVASVVYKSSPPVMTDARGRFSFDALDPGSYRLTFAATGYVKQDYGERAIGTGYPLTLTSGQSKADIVMHMVRPGAISGHIRDNAGQPVAGIPVEIFRSIYDKTGQRRMERVAVARTNDLGEYRIYALLPGRYYLSAGGLDMAADEGYSTPNRIPQNYAQIYYPAAAGPISATAIEVQSGADIRGIDLLVGLLPRYRVRGRVANLKTGQPPQRVTFILNLKDPAAYVLARVRPTDLVRGTNPNYRAADGTFELQNIHAGAYLVGVSLPDSPLEGRQTGFVSLNVNGDMDGVVLALDAGGTLHGRIRVEPNASAPVSLNLVQVQLKSRADAPMPMEFEPQPSPTTADGKFRFDNLRAGDYRVSIPEMPKGFYLKEARLGETDTLNAPLHYRVEDTAVLDIVLSSTAGVIDGIVLDAVGQLSPGAQVVLIPNGDRERTELYRQITADSTGRFTLASVAPGEYTLAAWDTLELYAFFDPELIRQAERQGKVIRVGEASTLRVDVSAIPSK